MKSRNFARLVLVPLLILMFHVTTAHAQGTTFTYQGQLTANGVAANGNYDFIFALFRGSSTNSSQVGVPQTNLDVGVTNGLFIVALDFGAVFTGQPMWLAIAVRTNGGEGFTALSPLQELTPTPYAIYSPNAGSVAGSNIVGTITGAFSGNGAGLTNLNGTNLLGGSVGTAQLASGALAAPVGVVSNGMNATPNTSYVVTSPLYTSIDLPTNANLGDVIQITSEGSSGWTANLPMLWEQMSAPIEHWWSVASSSSGSNMVAVINGGGIYTSTNSGTNWTPTAAPTESWFSVASSSSGTRLVATTGGDFSMGRIYTSPDSGASWSQSSAPSEYWTSVASSSDGSHLAAAAFGVGIYTSTNFGTNWTLTAAPLSNFWYSVASSSDGTHLVAVEGGNLSTGGIYTSTNSGTTWIQRAVPNAAWFSVASSSDGTYLAAAVYGGGIYTSSDSGQDWAQTTAPSNEWYSIASSSDGSHLVAVSVTGNNYFSPAYGEYWEPMAGPLEEWTSVASSADGSHLVAVSIGGIYIFGTSYFSGNAGTSASFQYLGNGLWNPIALSQDSLPGNVVVNNESGVTLSGTFSGDGSGLSNLTLDSLLTNGITYITNGLTLATGMKMGMPLNANDYPILLKAPGDINHGIGYATSVTNFNGLGAPDGPILWGYSGGALGSMNLSPKLDLVWTQTGQVGIGTNSPNYPLEVNGNIGLDSTHLIFNNSAGCFDVGPGGSFYFRVDNAQGNISAFGTPMTLAANGDLAITGALSQGSDRNSKEGFLPVNPQDVLAKVAALPIQQWEFKARPGVQHIGPMSQDFHRAFGLNGQDDKHIAALDEEGVALAAIQGLKQKLEEESKEKDAEIEKLKAKADKVDSLEKQLDDLRQMVQTLSALNKR